MMTLLFVPESSRHIRSKLQYVIRLQNSFQQPGLQAKLATLGGLHLPHRDEEVLWLCKRPAAKLK